MARLDTKASGSDQDGESHTHGGRSNEIALVASPTETTPALEPTSSAQESPFYKVYKRRFFGLGQLVLLNIIVSWDWLSFSAVSKTSADYFRVSEGAINWLSTGFLFAFCVASPAVIWTLNKGGPKPAIIATAVLILVGNWIRYAGTRASSGHFGVVLFGQILIGLAQPFCLSAPTRYSDTWFTDRGRISATAVASLANPFGGALGQLIDPFWTNKASDIPNMVLYISIISSIACIPSFFIPAKPPTPPSASSAMSKIPLRSTFHTLSKSVEFWLIFIPFSVYVGFFNSISSLINQILEPYSFTETQAGITGALLILIGLLTSAIISPLTDRYKFYLPCIKTLVPIIALSYLVFIWAPPSGTVAAPYVVGSVLGAASFALVPVVLEYLVEILYPMSPEVGSTICWTGGQLLGGIFIVVQNALKAGDKAHPPFNMHRALVFEAVVAMCVVPLPLCLGAFGRTVRRRRLEVDQRGVGPGAAAGGIGVGDGVGRRESSVEGS